MKEAESIRRKLLVSPAMQIYMKMNSYETILLDSLLNLLNTWIAHCKSSDMTETIVALRRKLENLVGEKFRNPFIYDMEMEQAAETIYIHADFIVKQSVANSPEIVKVWAMVESSFSKPSFVPESHWSNRASSPPTILMEGNGQSNFSEAEAPNGTKTGEDKNLKSNASAIVKAESNIEEGEVDESPISVKKQKIN